MRQRQRASSAMAAAAAVMIAIAGCCAAAAGEGSASTCGPYLSHFHCNGCSKERLSDGRTGGTLLCLCQPSSIAGIGRTCNVVFPQGLGPGIPSFLPLRSCDALVKFTMSGFKEITLVQTGAFASVGRGLRELRLTKNELITLQAGAFSNLTSLIYLSLSGNFLGAVDGTILLSNGDDMPNLETLDLSHNQITSVTFTQFSCYTKLRRLELNHNLLVELGENGAHALPASLRILSLDGNDRLPSVKPCTYYLLCQAMNLTSLSIRSMSWKCDCDVFWLRRAYNMCTTTESVEQATCVDNYDYDYDNRHGRSLPDRFALSLGEYALPDGCTAQNVSELPQRCPVATRSCHPPAPEQEWICVNGSQEGKPASASPGWLPENSSSAPESSSSTRTAKPSRRTRNPPNFSTIGCSAAPLWNARQQPEWLLLGAFAALAYGP